MKSLRNSVATLVLAISISTAAIAGEIQTPGYVPPPPPPDVNYVGEVPSVGETVLLELLLAAIF